MLLWWRRRRTYCRSRVCKTRSIHCRGGISERSPLLRTVAMPDVTVLPCEKRAYSLLKRYLVLTERNCDLVSERHQGTADVIGAALEKVIDRPLSVEFDPLVQ